MLAPLVELILQSQAFLVSFDRAYRLHDPVDPRLRLELAELAGCRGAFARVVIREPRVPPDPGVEAFRQPLQARLIGAGFLRRAVQVHQVGPGDHAQGRFAFAGMHVRRRVRFVLRLARPAAHDAQHVHDVIARRLELRLREVGKQAVVAAVTVHDDDLLAPVARHLVGRLLQQFQLQSPAVGDCAWLMFRLENLPEVVLGKDDGVFLLGGIERHVSHVEQIVSQWQMQPMLLQDAEWEQARGLRTSDGVAEVTCLLPFGILEKHGLHLPLGNDLLNVRYVALNAAQQEYAVVFPEYYFGQIFEAQHQPGTVAYSRGLELELLQETTAEMARNGCKKIIIVNGHGGNNSLLPYFAQSQLETPRDYVVYVLGIMRGGPGEPKHKSDPATDMHAGESETSLSMIARPDLVHLDRAPQESGADQARLKGLPEGLYTGIWWYARFPNHYAGEGAAATRELGEFEAKTWVNGIVQAIRAEIGRAHV